MSSKGSAYAGDGREYLQEPPAKQARYEDHPAQTHVIEAVTDESNPTVPVPQSDFEIEINSTSQESDSPAAEITLTTQGIPASSITIIGENEAEHVMTSAGTITEGHTASVVPVASSITVASVTSGGGVVQESISATQPAVESGTVTSTYTVAGISDQNQVTGQSSDLGTGQFIITPQSSVETTHASGPLYVMIPPSTGTEFLQSMQAQSQPRPIASHLPNAQIQSPPPGDDIRKHKEVVRKQTHNEVERRRRDRINDLIKMLAQIVPGCQKKDTSSGNIVGYVYSKGTVLEKTVEYLRELMTQNEQLTATVKLAEKSANALHVLQNQITVLEKENAFLRTQMIQFGLENTSGVLSARNLLSSPLAHSLLNTAQAQVATPPALSVPSTTQLLVSLAQSLTSNPLLAASLTQANTAAPSLAGSSIVPPSLTTLAQLSTPTAATQVSPSSSSTAASATSNQATLLINSLVQTLASIAAPSNTASQGQSPAINLNPTASLINNLLLAQNALSSSSSASSETAPLILPTTSADQGNSVVAS